MRKETINRGSATLEMTFIIPIILGVFYLYISLFMYMIFCSASMEAMTEELYCAEETEGVSFGIKCAEQGGNRYASVKDTVGMFEVDLEFSNYKESPVKNIRRWQFAANTFRTGKNE